MAKPSASATIDSGHALVASLVQALPFLEGSGGTAADYQGSNDATLNNGSWQTDADGPIWRTTSATDDQPITVTRITNTQSALITLAWRCKQASDNNNGMILGDNAGFNSYLWQRGGNYLRVRTNSGASNDFGSQTSFTTLVDYVLTYDGTNQRLHLYKNGTEVADSPLVVNDAFHWDTLLQWEGGDLGFVGDFSYFYYWSGRLLNATEAASLSSDPYQFFDDGGTTFDEDYAGTITPAGALAKLVSKAFDGSVTPAGALSKSSAKAFAGSSTPAGAIAKQTGKSYAGAMTPSGDPNFDMGKSLSGTIAPAGALSLIRAILRAFDGSITPVGTLAFSISKRLAGLITPVGTLVKSVARALAGSIATVGSLAKQTGKVLGGIFTPTGTLDATRTVFLSLAGSLAPVGTFVQTIGKGLAGLITSIGSMVISGGTPQAPPIFGGTIEIQNEQHTITITQQAQTIEVEPHPR